MDIKTLSSLSTMIRTKIAQSFRLYHRFWKEISLGIYVRSLTLILLLYIAFLTPGFPDINDMNQLLTQALIYMFQGLCPYGRTYTLDAFGDIPRVVYQQNFLNYGPVNLLLHIPTMIYPASFSGAGFMDFQPSFLFLHWFFDFLMFDRLIRMGHIQGARTLWFLPLMVSIDIVTHMSVVMFLILMGYEQWKNPIQSVFWLSLAALTYQYAVILLLFAIGYHLRYNALKVLIGLIPGLIVLAAFQAWVFLEGRPFVLVNDLLLTQINRPYEPWSAHSLFWLPWASSIPAVIFNVFGTDFVTDWTGGLIRLSTIILIIAMIAIIILFFSTLIKQSYKRSLLYSFIGMGLFLAGSPSGVFHHTLVLVVPALFTMKSYYSQYF